MVVDEEFYVSRIEGVLMGLWTVTVAMGLVAAITIWLAVALWPLWLTLALLKYLWS